MRIEAERVSGRDRYPLAVFVEALAVIQRPPRLAATVVHPQNEAGHASVVVVHLPLPKDAKFLCPQIGGAEALGASSRDPNGAAAQEFGNYSIGRAAARTAGSHSHLASGF